MVDLFVLEVAVGIILVAFIVIFCSWCEYKAGNLRDSKLMAAIGLIGGTIAYFN